MTNFLSKLTKLQKILIVTTIVIVCILTIVFGCVFGIKINVNLEHFYTVSTENKYVDYGNYIKDPLHAKSPSVLTDKVTRGTHYNPYTPSRYSNTVDYIFCGWYYDAGFTQPFISGTIITHDITLYAKWEEVAK